MPIRPGGKHPPVPEWQRAATTDPAIITSWWSQLYRGCGVGIATGPGSGVFVLDVDIAGDKTGDETLRELEARCGPLPATVTARTGSGGLHYFFGWPTDGTDVRNSASGVLGAGLDVRGDGGQVVAAPSMHASGRRYEWVDGRAPGECDVADAPPWLLELLTAAPVDAPRAPTIAPPPTVGPFGGQDGHDDSIAAWFDQATTWDALLAADGWTLTRTLGNGEQRWTRPGKSTRDGVSATVGHQGRDCLKVFTSSVPELTADVAYSKFGYIAATQHRGDRSACASALRKRRNELDGTGPRRHDDLSWAVAAASTAPLEQPAGDETPVEIDHGWAPSDFAAIADANYAPLLPAYLRRTDGVALFYEARINALWGESGSAKSWMAQYAAAQVLTDPDAGAVLYIDHEDTDRGQFERFTALGVDPATIVDRLIHIAPEQRWNAAAATHLEQLIADRDVTLAVIDSTGEAMAADGAKPNDDDDTARWHRELPRFLTTRGVTVVLIDHIPKSTEGPKLFAIGSQRKRAAIGGAAYMVDAVVSPAKGKDGQVKITCAKDRHGTFPRGQIVADVTMTSSHDGRRVRMTVAPHEKVQRPTVLMERVSRFLEQHGDYASSREIERQVSGKASGVRQAIVVLFDDDYLEREMRTGRGGGSFFRSVKPYRDELEMAWAVDNSGAGDVTASTASQPRPNRVPAARDDLELTASPASLRLNTRDAEGDAVSGVPEDAAQTDATPVDNQGDDPWTLI